MRIPKLVQTLVLTGADSGLRCKSENYRARITNLPDSNKNQTIIWWDKELGKY